MISDQAVAAGCATCSRALVCAAGRGLQSAQTNSMARNIVASVKTWNSSKCRSVSIESASETLTNSATAMAAAMDIVHVSERAKADMRALRQKNGAHSASASQTST